MNVSWRRRIPMCSVRVHVCVPVGVLVGVPGVVPVVLVVRDARWDAAVSRVGHRRSPLQRRVTSRVLPSGVFVARALGVSVRALRTQAFLPLRVACRS